jgi:ribosomal protein S25
METFTSSYESKHLKTPEEEIAFLKEQLAQKEREVALEKSSNPEARSERLAKETIKEYKDAPHVGVLHKDHALSQERTEGIVLELSPEEHDEKISEILGIMQEHGIKNALAVVEKMNDPHVQDDFERFLVQYLKAGLPMQGMSEKTPEFKALHMTLYEVTLPEKTEAEEKGKALKEVISSMEQFYSGMTSVDVSSGTGYFTMELAVANNSDDFTFNVAVHDSKKSLFEKQMLSIFHNAKIVEKKDDYNIFNEKGSTVASVATYKKNSIWPLKTYDQFDHDPLNSILTSFSKIKTQGQGAALQLVIRPQDGSHIKRYKKTLEDIMKGEKVSDALSKNDEGFGKYVGGFLREVSSFIESKEDKEKAKEKKKEAAQLVDKNVVDQINLKIAAPVASVNLRIVVSAENELVASQILQDIESSFNQFENTLGNTLSFSRMRKGDLKSLLYDFTFRLADEKYRLLTNLKELTSLIHFPAMVMKSSPHLKTAKAGSAPAPLELSKEGVLLGVNRDRGVETKVLMSPEDRLRHFYVIGQTGTGKTTLLKNMIAQDIANGEGVCMIDPHGSDIEDILALIPKHRYEDVIYFDPSHTARPMAFNMLEYDRNYPEQKTFVVNEMLSIFNKLFDMKTAGGPMFEQYFRNAVLLVMEDPESGNTLLDVSRILSNKAFRELKLSKCQNPIVIQFWKEVADKAGGEAALANIVPYITSKFDVFLSNDIMRPIIAQESSSINFREILDTKKILLINLSKGRLGDINANLIGLIVVGKILMAALSRVDSLGKNLPPFYLYIDEFQNVTTNSISTILSEARKYKLSLSVAHQFIAQLEEGIRDSVFGNVGSIATFRVGAEDAEYLEKQFSPVFTAKDIMSIDNRNAYIKMLAHGRPVKPFNIETMTPPQGNKSVVDAIKQLSHLKYGRDRKLVEEEIMKKYRK